MSEPKLDRAQANCVLTHPLDCYCQLRAPSGYVLVGEGESRAGDLQHCGEHGWEPCEDVGVPVAGFNALARESK